MAICPAKLPAFALCRELKILNDSPGSKARDTGICDSGSSGIETEPQGEGTLANGMGASKPEGEGTMAEPELNPI